MRKKTRQNRKKPVKRCTLLNYAFDYILLL